MKGGIDMFLTQDEKEIELQRNKRRIVANCKYCHGTGFVQKTDADGYDKSFICSCSSIVQRNIRLVDWGFPKKFLDDERWNLKLLQGRPYYESVKSYIDNFQSNYDEGKGLFIHGAQGRGKTTIECIIAKHIALMKNPDKPKQEPFNVGFSMYEDIVQSQLDNTKRDLYTKFIYKSDLLIIDNVGNETGKNSNGYSQRLLEMILRKRDNFSLPTIISTNFSIDEMGTEYNKDVKDFILQNDEVIYFSGDNYRVEQGKKECNNDKLVF